MFWILTLWTTALESEFQQVFFNLKQFFFFNFFLFVSTAWPCLCSLLDPVASSFRSQVLQTFGPVPALLPTQTLIQSWLICPSSDCPELIWMAMKEEWEQKKRQCSSPHFQLQRRIRETIIRNGMLSSALRLPALNIQTTDKIYK